MVLPIMHETIASILLCGCVLSSVVTNNLDTGCLVYITDATTCLSH